MTASIGWNSGVPESYVKAILPTLLDIHLFGQCGFNLDGTPMKSSGGSSAGSALVDLGKAEACLDLKRSLKHVVSKVSADSTLLRILMAPDDVILEQLVAEDFGATVQQVKKAQNYLIKSQAGKEIRSNTIPAHVYGAGSMSTCSWNRLRAYHAHQEPTPGNGIG